jgi:hypothetical protein
LSDSDEFLSEIEGTFQIVRRPLKVSHTMRATSGVTSVFIAAGIAASCLAQSSHNISGRWEGIVEIPGRPFRLVIDLAPGDSDNWTGSATVPGFNVKGTPLANLAVSGSQVEFTIKGVLGDPRLKAQLKGDALKGDLNVSGNTARFTLRQTGPAQVDLSPKSTPVQRELEGQWIGSIVYAGSAMQVRLSLTNKDGAASANLVFVKDKDLPVLVALVLQEDSALSVETAGGKISLEATFDQEAREISGAIQIGGTDIPIVLRKGDAK